MIGIVSYSKPFTQKSEFIKVITYPLAAMMTPNQSVGLYTPVIQQYPTGMGDYIDPASLQSFDVSGLQ